jgi:hypothetical protein
MKYSKQNWLEKLLNWKVPYALPSNIFDGKFNNTKEYYWENWNEEMKYKFPVKYFIFETLPDYISYYYNIINQWFYKIKSLYFKKRHLLDIRPNNKINYKYGYCDPCEQILYANMAILCNFIEKEYDSIYSIKKEIDICKKENHDRGSKIEKALEIYNWWMNYTITYNSDKLYNNLYNEQSFYNEQNENLKKLVEFEKERDNEIKNKLKELIDIREFLWT